MPDGAGHVLRHRPDVLRHLGMGLYASAAFVDWFGRGALDILPTLHLRQVKVMPCKGRIAFRGAGCGTHRFPLVM